MTVKLLVGDARRVLASLPAESVHAWITSPPYLGLRQYSTEPQLWGGDSACSHAWRPEGGRSTPPRRDHSGDVWLETVGTQPSAAAAAVRVRHGETCERCGSWRGELGSEPTVELYVAHLVEVFRAARRVLHPSGVLVLNLGDSYAGSGKGHGVNKSNRHSQGVPTPERRPGRGIRSGTGYELRNGEAVPGYKPKDLMLVPFLAAEALRADGWYLRSVMPWIKRASMPESVQDRPHSALEWVFLFSKSRRYFWDKEAIRRPQAGTAHSRGNGLTPKSRPMGEGVKANTSFHAATSEYTAVPGGRAFRNTDPYFASLDLAIADCRAELRALEAMKAGGGLLLDGEGLPLALDLNPEKFRGAHFATFGPQLVEPFVRAGTSERGACRRCSAPWRRVMERTGSAKAGNGSGPKGAELVRRARGERSAASSIFTTGLVATYAELGWAPSCRCDAGDPIPCTAGDMFGGSGTVGLVADRLGRDALLVELQPEYARMAEKRIRSDAAFPGMAQVDVVQPNMPLLSAIEAAV